MKKLLTIAVASLALGACAQIEAGESAVFTHYGKPEQKSFGPGFYWYNPWSTDIIAMNVQQRKWGDVTETYTKDVQKANVRFVLNYHLNGAAAHRMYQRVGEEWADNILPQATIEIIKNELGRVDAVTLVATRGEVSDKIFHALKKRLALQDVVLDGFDLTDISYTGEFEQAVENKQVAVQNAITAQNRTLQFTEEAKQAVIKAEGEAKALQITSNALQGDPRLLELKAIEAWQKGGSKVPQTVVGNTSPPFINLGNK